MVDGTTNRYKYMGILEYSNMLWMLGDKPLIFNAIAIATILVIAESLSIYRWVKRLIEQMKFKRDTTFWMQTL